MADRDIEQIGDAATPQFTDLNPAIQAMVMLYLTGHVPHRSVVTDEQFRRAPELNGSDKVELIVSGNYSPAMLRTEISVSVYINGTLTTPLGGEQQ